MSKLPAEMVLAPASLAAPEAKGEDLFDYSPVSARQKLLMMAATLAEGETTIENAAQEPEAIDLANLFVRLWVLRFGGRCGK